MESKTAATEVQHVCHVLRQCSGEEIYRWHMPWQQATQKYQALLHMYCPSQNKYL